MDICVMAPYHYFYFHEAFYTPWYLILFVHIRPRPAAVLSYESRKGAL